MSRYFYLITILSLFCASRVTAQPSAIKIRKLESYFYIDKSISLKNGVNCIAITDKKLFEQMFGKMGRADTPNFDKEMVLVLLMPLSDKESTLKFERVTMKAGDFVEVYCSLDLNHHKIPYKQNSIAVAAIPRYASIKRVIFYDERKMKELSTNIIDE